jgi:hypothetical protein
MLDLRKAAVEGIAGNVSRDAPSGSPSRGSGKRPHWLLSVVAAASVLLVALIPIGANAKPDLSRGYVGTLVGYGERNVRFEVPHWSGTNAKVRFKAEGVELVCDDNSSREVDFSAIRLPLVSRTVFQGQRYRRRPNGDWSYYEVKGRLLGPRRAIGYLYYVEDPFDPPGSENRPECSTGGQLYLTWKARRIG